MTSTPRVLAIGISHSPRRLPQSKSKSTTMKPGRVGGGLRTNLLAQVSSAKAAGFELEFIQFKPTLIDARLQQIRQKLRDETVDLLVIGFGIRGDVEHTELFEKLVNLSREVSPGTRMGFNVSMEGTVEACRRGLGMEG